MAPLAWLEAAQVQRANLYANDLDHRQAEQLARLADLALAAFLHDDPQPGALAECGFEADVCRRGSIAILKHHAAPPGFELLFIRPAGNEDSIFFFVIVDNSHLSYPHGWFSIHQPLAELVGTRTAAP